MQQLRAADLASFIVERHRIFERRQDGLPKPWTKDPILRDYRFCNVYRELDKETQWIANNWRVPHRGDPHLWFAMLVARVINWSPTLEELGYPVPWDLNRFVTSLKARRERGDKVWTGAYMITTHKVAMDKIDYYAYRCLGDAWARRHHLVPVFGERLATVHKRLVGVRGISSFLAAQVIADVKYATLIDAPDWYDWAAPGLGSMRGMNRVLGRPTKQKYKDDEFLRELHRIRSAIELRVTAEGLSMPDAQDLQNCLCEFDKYERLRLGEGTVRNRFNGRAT